MTFKLTDLALAKKFYKKQDPLLDYFDMDQPYHSVIHHSENRVVTIARYRDTVRILSDHKHLQPFCNMKSAGWRGNNFDDIIFKNIDMPYCLKLEIDNTVFREITEKKIVIKTITETENEETWNENALDKDLVVGVRLKSAVLDRMYERLNWMRQSLTNDIVLHEHIYNNRYQQALRYNQNLEGDTSLLGLYADEFGVDLATAAKHCIFCYEENIVGIVKTERSKLEFEKRILAAEDLEQLQQIDFEWHYLNLNQL